MDNEDYFEKLKNQNDNSEYSERWDGAMDDVPAFAGDEFGQPLTAENGGVEGGAVENDVVENGGVSDNGENSGVTVENPETAAENGQQLQSASKLAGYGLDVACREYGIGAVVKAIAETDLTGRDAEQPVGSIYLRIAPNADERHKLFTDISQDEEYAKEALKVDRSLREQNEAVDAAKRLFRVLETNDRFAEIREKASAEGLDVVSYLVEGEAKPTLSFLFDKIGDNFDAEEVAEEIAEEVEEGQWEDKEDEDVVLATEGAPDL